MYYNPLFGDKALRQGAQQLAEVEEAAAGVEELRWQIQLSFPPAASPASCSRSRVCKAGGKSCYLITQVPCLHLHTPSAEKQTGDRLALARAGGPAGDAASGCWRKRCGKRGPLLFRGSLSHHRCTPPPVPTSILLVKGWGSYCGSCKGAKM